MPFTAISFQDGLISVDKLQRMADNDDYLYNSALTKPRGLVGLVERTADFSNAAGPSTEFLFTDLAVTPYSANRLLAVWVFIPNYTSGSTGILDSSTLQIMKNGVAIQTGYTDKKFISGAPHGDHTSFYLGCLDVHPTKAENTYNVQITTVASSGYQILDLSTSRPAQLWVEDLGEV